MPREIILPTEIEDAAMIEEWLSYVKGKKVKLSVPKIGEKEKLAELAHKNAMLVLCRTKKKSFARKKPPRAPLPSYPNLQASTTSTESKLSIFPTQTDSRTSAPW